MLVHLQMLIIFRFTPYLCIVAFEHKKQKSGHEQALGKKDMAHVICQSIQVRVFALQQYTFEHLILLLTIVAVRIIWSVNCEKLFKGFFRVIYDNKLLCSHTANYTVF